MMFEQLPSIWKKDPPTPWDAAYSRGILTVALAVAAMMAAVPILGRAVGIVLRHLR